jgi:hypothetical protein
MNRQELERQALEYLEYLCDRTGGVASRTREVPRADVARDLGIAESEVVGYLASRRYVEYDTGHVHLTPRGLEHLKSVGRCASPKGIEGRPNREQIEEAAARFMELLYDRLDGVAQRYRDALFHGIASEAGLEHDDDIEHVALEYLSERLGLIASMGWRAGTSPRTE